MINFLLFLMIKYITYPCLNNKIGNKLQSIDNIKEQVVSTNLLKLSEAESKRAANCEKDFAITLFTRPNMSVKA